MNKLQDDNSHMPPDLFMCPHRHTCDPVSYMYVHRIITLRTSTYMPQKCDGLDCSVHTSIVFFGGELAKPLNANLNEYQCLFKTKWHPTSEMALWLQVPYKNIKGQDG